MYHDMEAKHNSYCPNESEFRAYMVLMKLNEGDILRYIVNEAANVLATCLSNQMTSR